MDIKVDVTFNKAEVVKRINKAISVGQMAMTQQALKDSNRYVKKDTGIMEASSLKATDFAGGVLIWDVIYAKKNYYLGRPSKDVNPLASLMWAHKAEGLHGNEWRAILQKAIDKGV